MYRYFINKLAQRALNIEAFNEINKIEIKDCPFNIDLNYRLELVKNNISNNLLDINDISEDVLNCIIKNINQNKIIDNSPLTLFI